MKIIISIIIFLCAGSMNTLLGQTNDVKPIDWTRFTNSKSKDSTEIKWLNLLQLVTKNIVNDQWNNLVGDDNLNEYFDLGRKYDASSIRPLSQFAFTAAVLISSGKFDEDIIGESKQVSLQKVITIIKSIAKAHLVNGGTYNKKWGNTRQTALWAATTAQTAWFVWDEIPIADKEYLRKMIENEANWFIDIPAGAANDSLFFNTQAEENGWNARAIETAAAMMPTHKNFNKWRNKAIEYRLTAVARKADLNDPIVLDGRPFYEWVSGYNLSVDYAVGNHQVYPHPDYSAATILHPLNGALIWSLADLPIPESYFYNQRPVYKMFVDKVWNDSSSIYKEDGTIYWPIDKEKERALRYYKYSLLDALAKVFKIDLEASIPASVWEKKHLNLLILSQNSSTGEIPEEAGLRDPALSIATAYLLYWLQKNGLTIPPYPGDLPLSANSSKIQEETSLISYKELNSHRTILELTIQQKSNITITIFDLSGNQLFTLNENNLLPGSHKIYLSELWAGNNNLSICQMLIQTDKEKIFLSRKIHIY